jgi:prepilin-type N-terminal cleavage/methylation domain-containing protein
MKTKPRQSGLTLTEMVVVVSIVAVFTVLGLPAIRALIRSVESGSSARAMISAALSTARAIAAKEQHYAGVRFQNRYQEDNKGCQYMIFIVHDFNKTGLANGFRAVEGLQPIKLPDSVGVMEVVNGNGEIDDTPSGELTNKTTFSILFSPSGKLMIHNLWVRNKDGVNDNSSMDDVFNSLTNVKDNKIGMFLQDVSGSVDLPIEPSRNSFIIYDKTVFEKLNPNSRYDDYIGGLEVVYINPYTGTMINK